MEKFKERSGEQNGPRTKYNGNRTEKKGQRNS